VHVPLWASWGSSPLYCHSGSGVVYSSIGRVRGFGPDALNMFSCKDHRVSAFHTASAHRWGG
jgi:hypothetical protein